MPLIVAAQNSLNDYDFKGEEKIISTTQLIDEPYIRLLNREFSESIEIDVVDMLWGLDGTSLHYILEMSGSEYITELRLQVQLGDWLIKGKIDLFDIGLTRILYDYKKTSVGTDIYNPEGKEEWTAQANVNKFLMESNGIEVLGLTNILLFRDWKKTDYLKKQNRGYPREKVKIVHLPVWTQEQTIKYIESRIELHNRTEQMWKLGTSIHCSEKGRWKDPTVYAVKKTAADGRAISGGLCDTLDEAIGVNNEKLKGKGIIETREGTDKRCLDYCWLTKYCDYYKKKYALLPGQ